MHKIFKDNYLIHFLTQRPPSFCVFLPSSAMQLAVRLSFSLAWSEKSNSL